MPRLTAAGPRGCRRPGAPSGRTAKVSGAIGPATADYVHRGFAKAKEANAALVILQIDTPGGLDTAMRGIIQDILAAPMPVVVYVAPSGARRQRRRLHSARVARRSDGAGDQCRRGHAGAYRRCARSRWRQATGAEERRKAKDTKDKKEKAKPEKPGLDEKALNDAIAYIRSLAQLRGRNVAWAEKAVREAASIPAEEAVKTNVADLMAADLPQLLKKLDGRKVKLQSGEVKLDTKNLALTTHEPDWRNRLLAVIADPNIAYILMLLGIYGLFFGLWNPGYVLPGVIGGICLLLALYAFQMLPISYAGLGLILLGIAFMVGEAFMPSFGALGIGGLVAFVIGSIILFDTDIEGFAVAWQLIAAVAAMSAVFFFGVVYLALKSRQRKVVSGAEELIGSLGEAPENFDGTGACACTAKSGRRVVRAR